jgi:mono/diheme cytochrome c family protein
MNGNGVYRGFYIHLSVNLNGMKKIITLLAVSASAAVLLNCNPAKKVAATQTEPTAEVKPKFSYTSGFKEVLAANCAPCHFPDKGGNKKAYDNYANVKADIAEMIRRIELKPEEKGFMPFKRPKLSDSTIALFKLWREGGMTE